jgi:anti-sigma-K factor RskA
MSRVAATPQAAPGEQGIATLVAGAAAEPIPFVPRTTAATGMTAYSGKDVQGQPSPMTDLDEYRARRAGRSRVLWSGAAVAALVLLVLAGWLSSFLGRPYVPPGYRAIAVQNQPGGSASSAVLFYDPARRDAYFQADGLQALDAQKVYEMWLLPKGGGDPVPAGIFNAGGEGRAWHEIQAPADMAQYAGVAVSLENAPGGKVVGGPILLMGQYSTSD